MNREGFLTRACVKNPITNRTSLSKNIGFTSSHVLVKLTLICKMFVYTHYSGVLDPNCLFWSCFESVQVPKNAFHSFTPKLDAFVSIRASGGRELEYDILEYIDSSWNNLLVKLFLFLGDRVLSSVDEVLLMSCCEVWSLFKLAQL